MNVCPVDESSLKRISIGMTKAQVQALLGEPTDVVDAGREFQYGAFLSWGIVYVRFGEDGRLTEHWYDP